MLRCVNKTKNPSNSLSELWSKIKIYIYSIDNLSVSNSSCFFAFTFRTKNQHLFDVMMLYIPVSIKFALNPWGITYLGKMCRISNWNVVKKTSDISHKSMNFKTHWKLIFLEFFCFVLFCFFVFFFIHILSCETAQSALSCFEVFHAAWSEYFKTGFKNVWISKALS